MDTIDLSGKWSGMGIPPSACASTEKIMFTGTVPGCVHTDLLQEGILKNPFWRYNADDCQWIENWSWQYERSVVVPEEYAAFLENSYLLLEGLDVYCDIYWNNQLLGCTEDMFLSYRFPLKNRVRVGENSIKLIFYSPIAHTDGKPPRSAAFTSERLYTRRLQCTYYWDWVNRFVTCGIWRPIKVCFPQTAELEDVYLYTRSVDAFSAQIGLEYEFSLYGSGAWVKTELLTPDKQVIFEKTRLIVEKEMQEFVDITNPQLWYPNGYGEQPLYTVRVTLLENGVERDCYTHSFGIRTVKVLQIEDLPNTPYYEQCLTLKQGSHVSGKNAFWDRNETFSGFILLINETPIMCKGANWVPCEPFPSAETPEKITALLELFAEGHATMIRVWGGGIFEQDTFYQECDRLGLLVTQDFLMACGSYPEEEPWFLELLTKEAEYAAKKMRNSTCLVWWTGDNENAMNGDENMLSYNGRRAALEAIAPVLKRRDPYRYFMPSSPVGGIPYGSLTRGTTHNTNYIGEMFEYIRYHDFEDYILYFDQYLSRFCAEGPTMGAPSTTSLRKFMSEDDIFGDDDAIWRYHTKNNPSEAFKTFELFDYLKAIAEKVLGKFQNGQDKVFKMQYIQYEWVRITMELYRRNKWFSSGLIYWMLDDCWAASGWSLIDYYALPKASYYGFKRTSKPVIVCIQKTAVCDSVFVCNDSLSPITGKVCLYVQDFIKNQATFSIERPFSVAANTSQVQFTVGDEVTSYLHEKALLLCDLFLDEDTSDSYADRCFSFVKRPQDVIFPQATLTIIEQTDTFLTLVADQYVHAVRLEGEAVFEDNYFPLLPNERRTIAFRPAFHGKNPIISVRGNS